MSYEMLYTNRNHSPSAWREKNVSGTQCTIAVIGAGFSGTLVAIHLLRMLPAGGRVLLIERSGIYARGVAYAASEAPHLLNVRAANMSAFPDDPGHFENWLKARPELVCNDILPTEAGVFATRRIYGRYLQEALDNAMRASSGKVEFLSAEVEELVRSGPGWLVKWRNGNYAEVSGVVLACGNLLADMPRRGAVIHNPWAVDALRDLNRFDPVLVVGTGLTMVDLVLELQRAEFKGPVIAVSRRGLLPQPHAALERSWPTPYFSAAERTSIAKLLQAVRTQIRLAAMRGVGWRAVIDSLRPITAELWNGLPQREQARFLRHARAYWEVHRHRMAPSAAGTVAAWRAQGQLSIIRGRILSITQPIPGKAEVQIASTAKRVVEKLHVQRVIYATGLQPVRNSSGFLAGLLQTGLARLDRLELGLEVDAGLTIIGASGRAIEGLWALGPLVRGKYWECVAVPDIRIQAQQLAAQIAATQKPR